LNSSGCLAATRDAIRVRPVSGGSTGNLNSCPETPSESCPWHELQFPSSCWCSMLRRHELLFGHFGNRLRSQLELLPGRDQRRHPSPASVRRQHWQLELLPRDAIRVLPVDGDAGDRPARCLSSCTAEKPARARFADSDGGHGRRHGSELPTRSPILIRVYCRDHSLPRFSIPGRVS
jgi:hypothetical protein